MMLATGQSGMSKVVWIPTALRGLEVLLARKRDAAGDGVARQERAPDRSSAHFNLASTSSPKKPNMGLFHTFCPRRPSTPDDVPVDHRLLVLRLQFVLDDVRDDGPDHVPALPLDRLVEQVRTAALESVRRPRMLYTLEFCT